MIDEFLAFVEEHRDGWTVLFRELNASRPLAEQVATCCARDRRRGAPDARGRRRRRPTGLRPPASEGVAEAIVGAGESLANWWLKKPTVPREDVVDWYVGLARAAIFSRRRALELRRLAARRARGYRTPGNAPPSISTLWPVM